MATRIRAPSVAPTPMPALAPVVSPGFGRLALVVSSEEGVEVWLVDGLFEDMLFDWKSASLNRTMKGSAASVPYLIKIVSAVALTKVVFHVVHDEDVASVT